MNGLETMLAEKLSQSDIHFDASGSDAKVLRIAYQDLLNYLKTSWNIVGKEESDSKLASKIETLFKAQQAEFELFVSVWTGMWLRKWEQRVKLLLGDQIHEKESSVLSPAPSDAEAMWTRLAGKKEIVELVVSALVKDGELCATEILAENIVKTELAKSVDFVNTREQVVWLLGAVLHRAHDMAHTVNPLIFVKVDKGYYHTATN
jgi:hypothetical protein